MTAFTVAPTAVKQSQLYQGTESKDDVSKRELFACFLRNSKRRHILEAKRMKLTQVDPALLEVTPSDFLNVATSGVDFSGALEGLSKYLNKQ
jgi:hypothetical protein